MIGMEWAWLAPVLPLIAFVVIALFGRYLPGKGSFLSIAAIGAAFVLFWIVLADLLQNGPGSFSRVWFESGATKMNFGMTVDQLTVIMLGLVSSAAFAIQVYSLGYMHGEPRFGWYFAAHSLFAAAMLGIVLANNFLLLYITWELVGLCSYLLIGFYWERRSAAEAAKKAFVTTRIGDVALLIGILILFKATGTFDMSTIFQAAQHAGEPGEMSRATLTLAAILIFGGAVGKSAQFPLHVWLPDAMEGPTPVSALIHAATMVAAGVYLVARCYPLFEAAPVAMTVVASIGLITAFFAATMALVQKDLKRILAYSTISQLGFMMLALGSGGYTAGIFHLFSHGMFKALLFLGAGSVIHSIGKQDIWEMGGLWKKMPVTAILFTIGAFALMGMPPFSGFWSKDEVLSTVLQNRGVVFFAIAVIAAILTAIYTTKMVLIVFFGKPRTHEAEHAHESPLVMTLPMAALAVPATLVGLLALPWAPSYKGFGTFLYFGEPERWVFHPAVLMTSIAIAYVGFVWAREMFQRNAFSPQALIDKYFPGLYTIVSNKYYMDDFYQAIINKGVLAFGGLVALFDRKVVNDKGVNGPGQLTVAAGSALKYHETGQVSNYIMVVTVAAMAIIIIVALVS